MQSLIIQTLSSDPQTLQAALIKQLPKLAETKQFWQFYGFDEKLKIETIRELLATTTFSGGERLTIYLLNDFHLASREIQNTLLKVLEEPPAHVLLVLLAANLSPVLDTVRSRCRRLYLPPPKLTSDTQTSLATTLLGELLTCASGKDISCSKLAQFLLTEISLTHKQLKNSDLSLTAFTKQTITKLIHLVDQKLHFIPDQTTNPVLLSQLLTSLLQASKMLSVNVSAKNTLYWLAVDISRNCGNN